MPSRKRAKAADRPAGAQGLTTGRPEQAGPAGPCRGQSRPNGPRSRLPKGVRPNQTPGSPGGGWPPPQDQDQLRAGTRAAFLVAMRSAWSSSAFIRAASIWGSLTLNTSLAARTCLLAKPVFRAIVLCARSTIFSSEARLAMRLAAHPFDREALRQFSPLEPLLRPSDLPLDDACPGDAGTHHLQVFSLGVQPGSPPVGIQSLLDLREGPGLCKVQYGQEMRILTQRLERVYPRGEGSGSALS